MGRDAIILNVEDAKKLLLATGYKPTPNKIKYFQELKVFQIIDKLQEAIRWIEGD